MKHNRLLFCCGILLIVTGGRLTAQQPVFRSLAAYLSSTPLKAYRPFGGYYNTATGTYALSSNTTGSNNTADGYYSLWENTSGSANTAVGYNSLAVNTTGGQNTALGLSSMNANTTGSSNTAAGYNALFENTSGVGNTGTGAFAGQGNATGNYMTSVGYYALNYAHSESYSIAVGAWALGYSNSATGYNTAIGAYALYGNSNVGAYNTAAGAYSMYSNTSGELNTTSGYYSMYNNTTGSYNTTSGMDAMYSNTSGDWNVGYGAYALGYNTTGGQNVGLGFFAGPNTGNLSNTISLGYDAMASASNSVVVGNSSATSIGGYAGWTNFSDGRYKKNIQQNVPGLAFINKLTPITYTLDIDGIEAKLHANAKPAVDKATGKEISTANDPVLKQAMQEKSGITYTGFVAQDVEKAADSVGFTFSGVDKPKDANQSFYGLRYGDFVVPLVKAVQELSASSNTKDSVINAMQVQIDSVETKYASLQTQVNELKAMLLKNAAALSGASLDQNSPNPFAGSTTIGYTLPEGVSSAQMRITDITGKVLALIPLSGSGKNSITANIAGYAPGTYTYSLIVNGRLVSTRQMVAMTK